MKKLLVSLLFVPMMAHAEFETGNSLLSKLESTNVVERMFGVGYVIGVVDAYLNVVICPPPNVNVGQITDMIKNYLQNTPAIRHRTADLIIADALKPIWACKNQQRQNGKAI